MVRRSASTRRSTAVPAASWASRSPFPSTRRCASPTSSRPMVAWCGAASAWPSPRSRRTSPSRWAWPSPPVPRSAAWTRKDLPPRPVSCRVTSSCATTVASSSARPTCRVWWATPSLAPRRPSRSGAPGLPARWTWWSVRCPASRHAAQPARAGRNSRLRPRPTGWASWPPT